MTRVYIEVDKDDKLSFVKVYGLQGGIQIHMESGSSLWLEKAPYEIRRSIKRGAYLLTSSMSFLHETLRSRRPLPFDLKMSNLCQEVFLDTRPYYTRHSLEEFVGRPNNPQTREDFRAVVHEMSREYHRASADLMSSFAFWNSHPGRFPFPSMLTDYDEDAFFLRREEFEAQTLPAQPRERDWDLRNRRGPSRAAPAPEVPQSVSGLLRRFSRS